jgi:hypothetical protein
VSSQLVEGDGPNQQQDADSREEIKEAGSLNLLVRSPPGRGQSGPSALATCGHNARPQRSTEEADAVNLT